MKSVFYEVSGMDYPVRYSILYLEQHYHLFVCNLDEGSITEYPISREKRELIAEEVHDYRKASSM